MSDDRIIDLRQASVNDLLKHLGGLVDAIQRSNDRYVRQERELGEIHTKVDALSGQLSALATQMREGFREVRSDLVLMENRLLTAEHKAARSDLEPR
jgi:hypothetical protein